MKGKTIAIGVRGSGTRVLSLPQPFIALLIPMFKVMPPLYRWRVRSRIYRWYDELYNLRMHLVLIRDNATKTG